jgi:hypothetical protein
MVLMLCIYSCIRLLQKIPPKTKQKPKTQMQRNILPTLPTPSWGTTTRLVIEEEGNGFGARPELKTPGFWTSLIGTSNPNNPNNPNKASDEYLARGDLGESEKVAEGVEVGNNEEVGEGEEVEVKEVGEGEEDNEDDQGAVQPNGDYYY